MGVWCIIVGCVVYKITVIIWGAKNPQPQFFQVLHVLITLSILCIIHEITWQPKPIKPIPCSLCYIFNSYSLYLYNHDYDIVYYNYIMI